MAYYGHAHVKRLEAIQGIKLDYLKTAKTSRISLGHIKHKISESYSLVKKGNGNDSQYFGNNETKSRKRKEGANVIYPSRGNPFSAQDLLR